MNKIIWKSVSGYEDLYRISNTGVLLSVKKVKNRGREYCQYTKKSKYTDGHGYIIYTLSKNGRSKKISAHRLVAINFLKNSENKAQVNHINGLKYDNRLVNLEWVTPKENCLHAVATGLTSERDSARRVICGKKYKQIIFWSMKGFNYKQISHALNIGETTTRDVLNKKRYISMRSKPFIYCEPSRHLQNFTAERYLTIETLKMIGFKNSAISKGIAVPESTIRSWMRRSGTEKRARKKIVSFMLY